MLRPLGEEALGLGAKPLLPGLQCRFTVGHGPRTFLGRCLGRHEPLLGFPRLLRQPLFRCVERTFARFHACPRADEVGLGVPQLTLALRYRGVPVTGRDLPGRDACL